MEKTFYVAVPEEEFYQRLGEAVYSVFMRNGFSVPGIKDNSKCIKHTPTAAYLKKTTAALYALSSARAIKFSKRGKQNYYTIEDLENYMERGIANTTDEIVKSVQLKPRKNYLLTKTK